MRSVPANSKRWTLSCRKYLRRDGRSETQTYRYIHLLPTMTIIQLPSELPCEPSSPCQPVSSHGSSSRGDSSRGEMAPGTKWLEWHISDRHPSASHSRFLPYSTSTASSSVSSFVYGHDC